VITLIKPDNEFDWTATKRINLRARALDRKQAASRGSASGSESPIEKEKQEEAAVDVSSTNDEISIDVPIEEYAQLEKSLNVATWASLTMTFIVLFVSANACVNTWFLTGSQLIPIPMFLSHYVFSLTFFKGWMIVCVLWLFVAACITSVLPLWESRLAIKSIFLGVVRDLFGGGLRKPGARDRTGV